jgi:hypothetical protein
LCCGGWGPAPKPPIPNPQSPIPNPQSPSYFINFEFIEYLIYLKKKKILIKINYQLINLYKIIFDV